MIILIFGIILGLITDHLLKLSLPSEKEPDTYYLSIIMNLVLFLLNLDLVIYLKLLLLFQIMIYASFYDYKTNKVDQRIHFCILGIGLIGGLDFSQFGNYLMGAVLALPFLIANVVMKKATGKIAVGLGDIKYIGALGFVLGFELSLIALCTASLLGVVMEVLKIKTKYHGKKRKIAFIPYLSIGYGFTILLMLLT